MAVQAGQIAIYGSLVNDTENGYAVSTQQVRDTALNATQAELNNKFNSYKQYTLPTASASTLGGVKVGSGLKIDNGILSATGGGKAESVDWTDVVGRPDVRPHKVIDLTVANAKFPTSIDYNTQYYIKSTEGQMTVINVFIPEGNTILYMDCVDFQTKTATKLYQFAVNMTDGSYTKSDCGIEWSSIRNKPTIPAAQVQTDWDETNTASVSFIKNKPNLGVYQLKTDMGSYATVSALNTTKSAVTDLSQKIVKLHASASMKQSVWVIEKGVSTEVTFTFTAECAGDPAVSYTMKQGDNALSMSGSGTSRTAKITTSDTATVTGTATFTGAVTKSASGTISAVYPTYLFVSTNGTATSSMITAGSKSVRTDAKGNYTVTIPKGTPSYWFLAVPNSGVAKPNTFSANGYDIPMAATSTVAVTGKGDYTVYRCNAKANEGTINVTAYWK